MKRILILLVSLWPILASAFSLTNAQKQEAHNAAMEFALLIKRYCEGERTLTTRINALCSGADCSAYDDINLNKEVTLRNYLLAIQKSYPTKLATEISMPSLTACQVIEKPVGTANLSWESYTGSGMSTAQALSIHIEDIDDYFIVFPVYQSYPSLGKKIQKNIVYSVKGHKITAYISTTGSYIMMLQGLSEFCNKNYLQAAQVFENAANMDSAGRGSLREACYMSAIGCYIRSNEYLKAAALADKIQNAVISSSLRLMERVVNIDYEGAYQHVCALESAMNRNTEHANAYGRFAYTVLTTYYIAPNEYPCFSRHQDLQKVVTYLRKSAKLGNIAAGHMMHVFLTLYDLVGNTDLTYEEVELELQRSAEAGYPPAYFVMGELDEYRDELERAAEWYQKCADSGSKIAWAKLGRIYQKMNQSQEAKGCLRKALDGKQLDSEIEDFKLTYGKLYTWPMSRSDVQSLYNSLNVGHAPSINQPYNNPSTNTPPAPSQSLSNNYSQHQSPSGTSSYTLHHTSSKPRKHFNAPKDEISGGLSFGYVQKQWEYKLDDMRETVGMFDNKDYIDGIQFGLRLTPQFDYGFAMHLGLYYEYYFADSEEYYDEYGAYRFKVREHSLYMPIHLKYNFNFSTWFQLSFYGGLGLDCGLSGKLMLCDDEETYSTESIYTADMNQKRFNASYEYGAAIRIRHVQFDCAFSKGFVNMSGTDEYKTFQNKRCNISISYLF